MNHRGRKNIRALINPTARAIFALSVALLFLVLPAPGARKIVERIIARVNNEIITLSHYRQQEEELRQRFAKESNGGNFEAEFEKEKKNLLRDMIDETLLVQRAQDRDVSVDTRLVRHLDDLRQKLGLESMEALEEAAKAQGLSWEDYREGISRQLMTQEIMYREVRSRIIISRQEVREYYEEHKKEYDRPEEARLQQIMISMKDRNPAVARKIAEEVLKKIKEEEDFANLARKYSDHSTAPLGGNTGWFRRGTMSPEFEKLAFELPVGETSDILTMGDELRIVRVADRHEAGIASFEEMEPRITDRLYMVKMEPDLRKFLVKLRQESHIRLIQGYVDTGAPPEEPLLRARRRN